MIESYVILFKLCHAVSFKVCKHPLLVMLTKDRTTIGVFHINVFHHIDFVATHGHTPSNNNM
jgi:hypothetical protein